MTTETQAYVFEIQLPRNSEMPAPAVKHRLEQSGQSRRQLTLDDINKKIFEAAKKREANLAKQVSDVKEHVEKIGLLRERRSSEERDQAERLSTRLATASEKRHVQINSIADRARTHNKQVLTRVDRANTQRTEVAQSRREQVQQRLQKAAEIREARFQAIKLSAAASCAPRNSTPSYSPQKASAKSCEM